MIVNNKQRFWILNLIDFWVLNIWIAGRLVGYYTLLSDVRNKFLVWFSSYERIFLIIDISDVVYCWTSYSYWYLFRDFFFIWKLNICPLR